MSTRASNGPKAVLYVMDTLGVSGRTKGIIDLALHLDPGRYRPVFCSFDAESSALVDRLRERSIPIEVKPLRPGLGTEGALKLMSLIRQHRIEVVHAVNPRPVLYAGVAARLLGIRATIGSFSAFACQTPDREYAFLPQELVNRGRRQALRNQVACGLMRYVVAVAGVLGERFCRFTSEAASPFGRLGYDRLKAKLRIISYGIDLAPYQAVTGEAIAALRARVGAGPDTLLVGSVGRLVEQKDYGTQLRAFAAAAKGQPRLRMVLAGEGPLRGEIEALIAELGIADRVVLLGHWTEVPLLLRALDVFVLASKFEPYGVALLEAKCAGTAIVATSVNEIPSLLEDGATGLIVPPESPREMADAFARLAADGELCRALGRNAHAEATRKHSIDAVASAYQHLYDDSLS
jgi:glycosyltransferase involved in cell wall biosynthesis